MIREWTVLAVLVAAVFSYSSLLAFDSGDDYQSLKNGIVKKYGKMKPVKFSAWTCGVKKKILTKEKIVAITLDACGGKHGSGYDRDLIEYLQREKIPATLFLCGKWIDANMEKTKELVVDSLFEIENHGLKHKPCSVRGLRAYRRRGTLNAGEVVDEVELNARKIQSITGRRSIFYRSGTAFYDDVAVKIIYDLGQIPVNFSVVSGDAVKSFSSKRIERRISRGAKRVSIIIGHMNHPGSRLYPALKRSITYLKKRGYRFVKLEPYRKLLR